MYSAHAAEVTDVGGWGFGPSLVVDYGDTHDVARVDRVFMLKQFDRSLGGCTSRSFQKSLIRRPPCFSVRGYCPIVLNAALRAQAATEIYEWVGGS